MLKSKEEERTKEVETLRRGVEILCNSMKPGPSSADTSKMSGPGAWAGEKGPPAGGGKRQTTQSGLTTSVSGLVLDRLEYSSPLPQRPPKLGMRPKPGQHEDKDRRGKSHDSSKVESRFDVSMVSDVDDASVDEVIYSLIELRNARRPHLPPLINPLKGNLTVAPPPRPLGSFKEETRKTKNYYGMSR